MIKFLVRFPALVLLCWTVSDRWSMVEPQDITAAALSPDGQQLVLGFHDGTAGVWDVKTGRRVVVLSGHKEYVTSAVFGPKGRRVLTGSWDGSAILWNADTARKLHVFHVGTVDWGDDYDILNENPLEVDDVAFSPDGKEVLIGQMIRASLWDAVTGKKLKTFSPGGGVTTHVAISNDGRRFLVGNPMWVGCWKKIDGKNLQKLWELETPTAVGSTVAFSRDCRLVMTSFWAEEDPEWAYGIWEGATGKKLAVLRGAVSLSSAAFNSSGRQLLTGNRNGTVILWNSQTGLKMREMHSSRSIVDIVHFSTDDKYALVVTRDGEITLWNTANGKKLRTFKVVSHTTEG